MTKGRSWVGCHHPRIQKYKLLLILSEELSKIKKDDVRGEGDYSFVLDGELKEENGWHGEGKREIRRLLGKSSLTPRLDNRRVRIMKERKEFWADIIVSIFFPILDFITQNVETEAPLDSLGRGWGRQAFFSVPR